MFKQLILTSAIASSILACNETPKPAIESSEAITPATQVQAGSTYTIDTTASTLEWEGYEGLSLGNAEHTGTLKIASGTVQADSNRIVSGEIAFNIRSIAVTDIPLSNSKNAKLTKHLLSADFFDTDKFPEAKFVITGVQPNGTDSATVSGNLTLKGTEKNISFPAAVTMNDSSFSAVSPTFYINRKDWGMHYRSENSLGDELIRHELGIKLNIKGKK